MSSDYIGRDGEAKVAIDNLSPERKAHLIRHNQSCEIALTDCPECWELYSSIGHDAYVAVLTSEM